MTNPIKSIISPKTPHGNGWVDLGPTPITAATGFESNAWEYPAQQIVAISAVEVARDPNDIDKGPEYHLSISKPGARCTRNEARFVTKAFDMTDAEEDNHVPGGFVRNYWLPVAENLIGHECQCKTTEPAIKEDSGDFVWRGINS